MLLRLQVDFFRNVEYIIENYNILTGRTKNVVCAAWIFGI
jgi:hypothetical protein